MHLDIKVDGLPLLQRSFVVIWWSNVAAPFHSHCLGLLCSLLPLVLGVWFLRLLVLGLLKVVWIICCRRPSFLTFVPWRLPTLSPAVSWAWYGPGPSPSDGRLNLGSPAARSNTSQI